MTSGWRSRISRILVTDGIAASSEMVGGIEARIHRLPSSSAGRNSVPSRGASSADEDEESDRRTPTIGLAVGERPVQGGRVERRASARTTMVSVSSMCWGSSSDASTGVIVKVAISAPASAKP